MPKRARCPRCDRLFDRRVLDDHIRKCRFQKQVPFTRQPTPTSKVLVVDGNNVAYHLAPMGVPHAANLLNAINSLVMAGYRPLVVISAALKHKIDRPMVLMDLISKGYVIEAPSGTDDDLLIIKQSRQRGADIVSNDRFLNWLNRFPWLVSRLRRYRLTPSGLILT